MLLRNAGIEFAPKEDLVRIQVAGRCGSSFVLTVCPQKEISEDLLVPNAEDN